MPEIDPKVILRLGSHSEKEYIDKTSDYFNGVLVGANLIQATPGASASLLIKLKNKPYYVDPMTYAFGAYLDPATGEVRTDLDWIKSEQKVQGKKGQTKRDYKRSYRKLADAFQSPFSSALSRNRALAPPDFQTDQILETACRSVLTYQRDRLREVLRQDPGTATFADDLPQPAALFAPYFYIEPSSATHWINLNSRLAHASQKHSEGAPIHAVVCGHRDLLTDRPLSDLIISNLRQSGTAGVWLWFSRFDEHSATTQELLALRRWVEQLSPHMSVLNMHGGFYSLALSKLGMAGIAHGVGYGEQKDVVPVIGQSTPTVQYYVRSLHAKYSVPQITRCFSALGISTPDAFLSTICDCVICKAIIGENLNGFAQFGEIHYSTPESQRVSQTPAAAKRCRYHFLLNRVQEREYVKNTNLDALADNCRAVARKWSRTAIAGALAHLTLWADALL